MLYGSEIQATLLLNLALLFEISVHSLPTTFRAVLSHLCQDARFAQNIVPDPFAKHPSPFDLSSSVTQTCRGCLSGIRLFKIPEFPLFGNESHTLVPSGGVLHRRVYGFPWERLKSRAERGLSFGLEEAARRSYMLAFPIFSRHL